MRIPKDAEKWEQPKDMPLTDEEGWDVPLHYLGAPLRRFQSHDTPNPNPLPCAVQGLLCTACALVSSSREATFSVGTEAGA